MCVAIDVFQTVTDQLKMSFRYVDMVQQKSRREFVGSTNERRLTGVAQESKCSSSVLTQNENVGLEASSRRDEKLDQMNT
jgi:hypothetical protein